MTDSVIRLKIELDDTDPPIWRRIEVPADTSLKDLHHIIQAAMGRDEEHLFAFKVGRRSASHRVLIADIEARSDRRRVVKECASPSRYRGSTTKLNQKQK